MFTRKQLQLPQSPIVEDPQLARYLADLNKMLLEFQRSLNAPNALTIENANGIDNSPIGATTASTGKFTTLEVTTSSTLPTVTWTPTITAGSGTFTTVSATGKATKVGNLYLIRVVITVTTNGTAASFVRFTLPSAATEGTALAGRENGNTGKALAANCVSGNSVVDVQNYDGTYPAASGSTLYISGVFVP